MLILVSRLTVHGSWEQAEYDANGRGSFPAVEQSMSDRLLARIIHEHFCCNRRFAAATSLRRAGSPLAPSTYCTSMGTGAFLFAPVPVRTGTDTTRGRREGCQSPGLRVLVSAPHPSLPHIMGEGWVGDDELS